MSGTIVGSDGIRRCWWPGELPIYVEYHDAEWGFPVVDDRTLFEKLSLEGFQSGLSWLTILKRREGFRAAFHGFDIGRVAAMTEDDVERLAHDEGIIRHRGKIRSTIGNARRSLELIDEFGSLAAFFWQFEPAGVGPSLEPTTPESQAMAKELKRRGFTFVGPTTAYAFMQAMGIVNDHVEGCEIRAQVEQARVALRRPRSS